MVGAEVIQIGSSNYRVIQHLNETTRTNNLVSLVSGQQNGPLVIKRPRHPLGQQVMEAYYVLQDKFFLGARRYSSIRERYQNEKETLEALKGLNVPELEFYDEEGPTIVRKYIPGVPFRTVKGAEDKKKTLEGALELFQEIHKRKRIVGDGHPKNAILDGFGKVHWSGFAVVCNYDPNDRDSLERSQAIDVLKLVYLAYSAMGDEIPHKTKSDIVLDLATAAKQYPIVGIKWKMEELVRNKRLWECNYFATRLPADERRLISIILAN